jgi:short-subunit dehydrogenase
MAISRMQLKPVAEQTMVITGATSGIGLVTARRAARQGARLMLVARNEPALHELTEELRGQGCDVAYAVADVGDEAQLQQAADQAVERFGGFDTWVNNAAVSIYGRLEDVDVEDMRRLFDTNFWGYVYGSLAAVRHFRERGHGKLINIGSVLGERAIPIQGIYSASKHAVAGFTEALRTEIYAENLPVSVSLIKPSAIDTPYKDHAKNYMDSAPKNPPPVYEPEVVARAVLHAAEHDIRDLVVGGGGKAIMAASNLFPVMADHLIARLMPWLQRENKPAKPIEENNLYSPGEDMSERSNYAFAMKHSAYTRAMMYPTTTRLVLMAAGAVGVMILLSRQRRLNEQRGFWNRLRGLTSRRPQTLSEHLQALPLPFRRRRGFAAWSRHFDELPRGLGHGRDALMYQLEALPDRMDAVTHRLETLAKRGAKSRRWRPWA